MSHIIAVINQKGGVGKTTTAINLAAYLAKKDRSVLLVDMDPQGNATSGLGPNKYELDHTMYDILFGKCSLDQAILSSATPGLSLLPSNSSLAAAELDLAGETKREYKLQRALAASAHDYIIIDCPPALGLLTVNALTAAQHVLIPVQAEYYALEGLGQLLEVIKRVKGGLNPDLSILGLVVTMYDRRTALSDQVVTELRKHFDDKVLPTFIPRNVRLAEAPSFGKTIAEHDKWSKGARSYKQLAKEVEARVT